MKPKFTLRDLFWLVLVVTYAATAQAHDRNFERLMLPLVGKKVKVTGTLEMGSFAPCVVTKLGGVVYVTGDDRSDARNNRKLVVPIRLIGKQVAVTGTLGYRKGKELPEVLGMGNAHFYMDGTAATVEMIEGKR